jgi:hypothetical protein
MDEASGLCVGCARTKSEIASWRDAQPAVLERIWSELPSRRERLGIGLHRLEWEGDRIRAFVRDSTRAGAGTWVLGVFGAVAEFCVEAGERCAVEESDGRITARTDRAALRLEIGDQVRALAMTTTVGAVQKEVIVLAIPRIRARRPVHHALAPLGPDREAIRPEDRDDHLFDLGLGAQATAYCIRVRPPELLAALEGRIGEGWAELLAGLGGRIIAASPPRVVVTPIGRVEVNVPIPLPGGRSPDGPHTHFLPIHLSAGRETPPGLELPDALAPCAIFYPQAGPAEADACTGTSRPAANCSDRS